MGEEICGGNRWNHGAEGECTLCLWKPAGAWLEISKGREFDASSHRDRRLGCMDGIEREIWDEWTRQILRIIIKGHEDLASSSSTVNVYMKRHETRIRGRERERRFQKKNWRRIRRRRARRRRRRRRRARRRRSRRRRRRRRKVNKWIRKSAVLWLNKSAKYV